MGKVFLNSYNPLCSTKEGREAIKRYNQPKFADSSSRREPNLEGDFGCISSLCRAGLLVPKLNIGDTVVYMTKRGNYVEGIVEAYWHLASILEVIEICKNHKEAAEWFVKQRLPIPSNCIIEGNPPLDKELFGSKCHDEEKYKSRAKEYPTYCICKKIYVELNMPPIITKNTLKDIFGKVPGTENPKEISVEQLEALKKACKIRR